MSTSNNTRDRQRTHRRSRRLCGGVLFALLIPAPALAQGITGEQQEPPVTLADAARLALARYPAVSAAEALSDEASHAAARAAATRWPSVHLDASATRFEEPMLVRPLHGLDGQATAEFDRTLLGGSLTARYTLWDGGERSGAIDQARAEARAAAAGGDATRTSVLQRVVEQYAAAIAADQMTLAHEQRVQALEAERDRVLQLFTAGRAAELEVMRAEAALAEARAEYSSSAKNRDVLLRELSRLIGRTDEPLAPRLVPPALLDAPIRSRAQLVDLALASSPDVIRAEAELAGSRADVSAVRGTFLPDIQLIGRYDGRGSGGGDLFREWSVGGAISLPLFQGGARLNDLRRANARRERFERQLELQRLDVQDALDRAIAALEDAEAREVSLRSAVEQYAAVARAEWLALASGVGTQTDYINAQSDLLHARAQLAGTLMRGLAARSEIARVTGALTVDWLQQLTENER